MGSVGRRCVRAAEPIADLFPGADPGPQWRDPIVRPSDTCRFGDRGTPLPAGEPNGQSIGDAVGSTERAAATHRRANTDADPHTHARADTDADTDSDAGAGRQPGSSGWRITRTGGLTRTASFDAGPATCECHTPRG
jgi:hypothetical protein